MIGDALFAVAGAAAGLAQGAALRRQAFGAARSSVLLAPVLVVARLGVVALVLVLAARAGALLPAAAGWAALFVASCVVTVARGRRGGGAR